MFDLPPFPLNHVRGFADGARVTSEEFLRPKLGELQALVYP